MSKLTFDSPDGINGTVTLDGRILKDCFSFSLDAKAGEVSTAKIGLYVITPAAEVGGFTDEEGEGECRPNDAEYKKAHTISADLEIEFVVKTILTGQYFEPDETSDSVSLKDKKVHVVKIGDNEWKAWIEE